MLSKLPYYKFTKFIIVGSVGAGIQLSLTYMLTEWAGLWYMLSLCIAIVIATAWNFTGNLKWTFKERV